MRKRKTRTLEDTLYESCRKSYDGDSQEIIQALTELLINAIGGVFEVHLLDAAQANRKAELVARYIVDEVRAARSSAEQTASGA